MNILTILFFITLLYFNSIGVFARSGAVIDNEEEYRDPATNNRRLSLTVEEKKRIPSSNWLLLFNLTFTPVFVIGGVILLIFLVKKGYKRWQKKRAHDRARRRERARRSRSKSTGRKKSSGQKSDRSGTASVSAGAQQDDFPSSPPDDMPDDLQKSMMASSAFSHLAGGSSAGTAKSTTKSARSTNTASRAKGGKSEVKSASGTTSMHSAEGVSIPDTISEESTSDRIDSKEEGSDKDKEAKAAGETSIIPRKPMLSVGSIMG